MIWILLGVAYLVGAGASGAALAAFAPDFLFTGKGSDKEGDGLISALLLWPITMPIVAGLAIGDAISNRNRGKRAQKQLAAYNAEYELKERERELKRIETEIDRELGDG